MRGYQYHRPASLVEAFRLADANPGARFVAGGTDLMVRIRRRTLHPQVLISLRGVPELRGIQLGDEGVRIGATTSITDLLEHRALGEACPVLIQAAALIASPSIRNAATLGGNLCKASPSADLAPPLMVLGASVRLQGARGTRQIPLESFFAGPGQTCMRPGELLSDVLIPRPLPGGRGAFFKKGRVRRDRSVVSLAMQLQLDGRIARAVRLAAGSVAPVPLRLRATEALLEGKPLSDELIGAAARTARTEAEPVSDVRASAEYRRQIVGVYMMRGLRRLLEGSRGVA